MSELDRITDVDFDATIEGSDVPVLVFFTATWCGPSRMVLPIIQELKDDYGRKMLFCVLDIDESPKTPPKFGIRGLPTVLILKKSVSTQVVAQQVGAASRAKYASLIESTLS